MLKLLTWHTAHPIVFDATTHPDVIDLLTMLIAIGITAYFWRTNIIGIHESSDKALRIMQLTTVMAVIIFAWSGVTLWIKHTGIQLPPLHPVFTKAAWIRPSSLPRVGWSIFPKFWVRWEFLWRLDIRCWR